MITRVRAVGSVVASALVAVLLVGAPPGTAAAEGGVDVASVQVGFAHACAYLDDGSVRCWGAGLDGRLGLGSTDARGDGPAEMGDALPAVQLGTGRTATRLALGDSHTCALLDDGSVKCWGDGAEGKLGQGTETDIGDSPGEMGDALPPIDLGGTATLISAGFAHSCALLSSGAVKCWGDNTYGQLGLGDDLDRGDQPAEMGASLPAVDLGSGLTARAIAAGGDHTCAVLNTDAVKCWGNNGWGQLGQGGVLSVGESPGEMGDSLPPVDLGPSHTATNVAAGENNTCAILEDHSLKCWGDNDFGQLGQGDDDDRGDEAGEMGESLPPVALGPEREAESVSVGHGETCVVLDNGQVACLGENDHGQLGLGDESSRGDSAGELGASLATVALGTGHTAYAVTTSGDHTCALLDDFSVRCWGAGGLLGLGDTADRGDDPAEMGDALAPVDLGGGDEPVERAVDGEIRRGTEAAYVGNDIVNSTAAGQSRLTKTKRGSATTFVVRMRNESEDVDALGVKGTGGAGKFTVRYRKGATNVTAAVVSGTFEFPNVPAGAARTLTVEIAVGAKAVVGSEHTAKITSRSIAEPTIRDAVKGIVRATR